MKTVSVTLTNQDAWITKASKAADVELDEQWSFFFGAAWRVPSYKIYLKEKARAVKEGDPTRKVGGWDGKIRFYKQGCVPVGIFRATQKDIPGVRFKVTHDLPPVKAFKPGIHMPKEGRYKHQTECVDEMCAALALGGGIVLAATGTGKTATAAQFFSRVGYDCLFVVDQIDLLYQSQEEISRWLKEPVGVVGNQQYQVERVTVATTQTLQRHLRDKKFRRWFRKVKIVLVDELHVQMGRKTFKVLRSINPIGRYGLTATLQMKKKDVRLNAWAFAGPVIFRFPIKQAQKQGVVAHGSVLQLRFPSDCQGGGYQEEYASEVRDNEAKLKACRKIVTWAIEQGRCVYVLVDRIQHVHNVDGLFSDTSFGHAVAYGAVGKNLRVKARGRFEKGTVKLIIANRVFQKGINQSRVDVILDLAEMKDENAAVQKFGRGVRLYGENKQLLYIDFASQAGRFLKNAKIRARAFKAEEIPIKVVNVLNSSRALRAVQRYFRAQGYVGRGKAA